MLIKVDNIDFHIKLFSGYPVFTRRPMLEMGIPKLIFVPEFHTGTYQYMVQGISVSIVSGYGLDDWAIEVRSPAEAR
jgi:hypothetical protein